MKWTEAYPRDREPSFAQIGEYIQSKCWPALNEYLQNSYGVQPKIEHSSCTAAPGWNVKYKKGGRSLCVLYPNQGFFTCMVCIGAKEAMEAELYLSVCSAYTQNLYHNVPPFNGARWLMLEVRSGEVMEDAKRLISTRVAKTRRMAQDK